MYILVFSNSSKDKQPQPSFDAIQATSFHAKNLTMDRHITGNWPRFVDGKNSVLQSMEDSLVGITFGYKHVGYHNSAILLSNEPCSSACTEPGPMLGKEKWGR